MITRNDEIKLEELTDEYALEINGSNYVYKNALFFDLEHYVYRKPVCIGVFGCCYYNEKNNSLIVTQYMIENQKDSTEILQMVKDYFISQSNNGKKYIVTFSGNNDFTVVNYLFEKYKMDYKVLEHFSEIDLQSEYEKRRKVSIGLKNLEKEFDILRDSELISGSNLAKTFCKIVKDDEYAARMPEEKKQRIMLYNEQDVVSLFHICNNWNRVLTNELVTADSGQKTIEEDN